MKIYEKSCTEKNFRQIKKKISNYFQTFESFISRKKQDTNLLFLLIFIEVFAFLGLANQRLVYRYTLPQDAFRVDDANILAESQTF